MPVISAMGNLPIVKDLVVDMDPFWAQVPRAMKPWLQPGLRRAAGRQGAPRLAGADERDPQGVALHQLRLLRLRVQLDGVRPGVPRPGRAREGHALRRRRARPGRRRAARATTTTSTGSGSAPAATSATSAARRASTRATRSRSSAPSRSSEGIDRDMGAKHAKWFVTSAKTTGWLRETELVPKTQGIVAAIKQTKFALGLAQARQGAAAVPAARRRRTSASRARSTTSSRSRAATARSASSRASTRSARLEFTEQAGGKTDDPEVQPGVEPPHAEGCEEVAYYKGCLASLSAKELDSRRRRSRRRSGSSS